MGQTSGLGNKHRPPYREGWRSVSSMDLPAGAFVGSVAGSMGVPLKKGMGTIKTVGKTGLGKYTDFVHKMGNYQGKTKREMGRLYQNNKELNNAVSTYDNFEKGFSGTSAFRKEE